MTAIEDNAAETESDPYRVHAITPDISKSQERLAAPNPAPAAAERRSRISPPTSLSPLPRPRQSQSLRPSLTQLPSRSPRRRLICLRLPPPPN